MLHARVGRHRGTAHAAVEYTFASGSAVNLGNNSSAVTTTATGAPVITGSASGAPSVSGLGMALTGANYLTLTATSLPNLSGSANYTIGMWIQTTKAGAALLGKGPTTWPGNTEQFFLTSGVGNGTGGTGTHMGGVQSGGGWVGETPRSTRGAGSSWPSFATAALPPFTTLPLAAKSPAPTEPPRPWQCGAGYADHLHWRGY